MIQQSLFPEYRNTDLPLPLLVARHWNFKLQHHIQNDEYFYAVQDWIVGVAELSNTKAAGSFWRSMQKRLDKSSVKHGIELRIACTQLPYVATNGKTYQLDFTDADGLYAIVQRMGTNTGLSERVEAYLRAAGITLDKYRLDPEQMVSDGLDAVAGKVDSDRLASRINGIQDRKFFAQMIYEKVRELNPGNATNIMYRDLFGADASGLRKQMGLSDGANVRDHMSRIALNFTALSESVIAELIQQTIGDSQRITPQQAIQIIHQIAQPLGVQASELGLLLGIDILTGNSLLSKGN